MMWLRFIPACAGNSRLMQFYDLVLSVHPRVCGEQVAEYAKKIAENGSSPRVRGTAHVQEAKRVRPLFIPACAGNRMTARFCQN